MKLTPNHHKNSQLHMLPSNEIRSHRIHLECKCGPKISTINGHLQAEHKRITDKPKEDVWSLRVRNFGKKLDLKGGRR
jgi:hypothetical protein